MFRNIFSSAVFSHPMESSMPYPAEHHHLTKHKIIRSARRRFNRHGFDAVSIDDVMADAGLTKWPASSMSGHARPWDLKPRQRNLTPVLRRPVEPATQSGHERARTACPVLTYLNDKGW